MTTQKRFYTAEMENGDIYGVPAKVIARHYANHYASKGENYDECYGVIMGWFDAKDYEFEDWATNNMSWDEVKEHATLIKKGNMPFDFDDGWMNGEHGYEVLEYGEEVTP